MAHRDIDAFHALLRRITAPGNPRPARILALCGAGLSAASGLATFRGSTAALWHTHNPMELATPDAFDDNPGLVWRFYAYRRHVALQAQPNAGHRALAALATKLGHGRGGNGSIDNPAFLCLTQNVDGLSQRADHPRWSLRTLHGSLFDLRCVEAPDFPGGAGGRCDYRVSDNFDDPLCPALSFEGSGIDELARLARTATEPPTPIPESDLPQCPRCREHGRASLLRPGVVWFGESLDPGMMRGIRDWIRLGPVDLMLVVGTSAEVQPAASYIDRARSAGAVVVTVNLDAEQPEQLAALRSGDFAFGGSAADILPQLLAPVIGDVSDAAM